ncbi:substrate-binding domain-containing protein [Oceanispirochaeta crateris]|nr:substrate-binding domain-containing protein [Oceanispirochaeta crateris]
MKKQFLFLLFVCLSTILYAAGSQDTKEKKVIIAVVPQQLGNVVFLPAKEGAEQAGKDLGITMEWQAPVRAEAQLQAEVIEGLIARNVDGIAISCNHPDALKDVLKLAISKGIIVSTFDADSPESGREFYAGTENYQAGVTCGEEMLKLFSGTSNTVKVAILEGIPGAFDIESRKSGFLDTIADSNLEVVYTGACDDDVDKSVTIVEDYTRANPEIDAWFMAGGWPYIVQPGALPEMTKWKLSDPENHKVVTMDVFPSSKAFFDKDLIDVAVGQDFYSMGYLSVENLHNLITGGSINGGLKKEGFPGLFIDTGGKIVTPDNYKEEFPE